MLTTLDQRVIASLRDKSLRRPGSGPRVAVVANCQNFSIAYAMKLLNVEATVHPFPVMFKPWLSVKTLTRALKLYDYVFLQPFGPRYVRGGTSDTIVAELKNLVLFPTIVFTGFHPDQIYVEDRTLDDNARIGGPLGPYHSALAFFAYRAGLPVDAALRLLLSYSTTVSLGGSAYRALRNVRLILIRPIILCSPSFSSRIPR